MKNVRYSKKWEILVNPTWEQSLAREPLLAFSFILSTRNNQLATIADEILELLDPDEPYSAREIIDEYFSIIYSLSPKDVKGSHEESYNKSPNKSD